MSLSVENAATRVMIAEDDDDDYYIFSVAMEEISFTVMLSRAIDGEMLLKMMEVHTPDILFIDLMMPCKNGKECLREIRSNTKYDTLPIIVYSSLSDLTNVEYCYREGSNLFAIKPNSIGELKVILERILSINWKKTLYFPPKSEFVMRAG